MSTLLLILLISTLGIDSTRGTCVADCDWSVGEWGECSRSCGGGYQTRNRTRCCHDNESSEVCQERCQSRPIGDAPETNRPCNKICFNGGEFDENTGQCRCRQGWTSTCCQEVSTSYKFTCISTSKPYQAVDPQVADEPETTSLSRVYVVKAQRPNEPFIKENYVPLNINIVIRLCSYHAQSIGGCAINQTSTYLNLLHNGAVIYSERSGYLRDVSHVFLEIPFGDRALEYDWIPEFLNVNGQFSHFHCSREFSHDQHTVLGRHRRRASRSLKIVIRTSGSLYSGTKATITMRITGDKGSSSSMNMDGSFQRGDVDTSYRSINEIGRIQSIRIWTSGNGYNPNWKLDWVHIYERSESSVKYEFRCDCWFKGKDNGRDLWHGTACPGISNCLTQRCRTCTTCKSRSKDVFFRLSANKRKCDITCSYVDNRWCWPGNCSSGLMTSCSCESGFRKSGNSTCDSECFTI
ncbi:uncharacterized protein LOC124288444 [Haliotis rubra]|uniref:uncharacterized protein LOC124288444 n=1 Tax=Haliotis rubra TaxID=36100 RepID=UPI001EE588AE|nr:uncharacterized protein LOC124288444 [Haliotis rubra]